MKIAVLVKQVPDSDEIKMDPVKGTMIREGTGNIVNPLDLNGLEVALALRELSGGEVSAISMGPMQTQTALRETLALGADSAFLASDRFFSGADSWATAVVLAEIIRRTGPFDIVLAGEKATDGETGQVGPEVAAMLGIPCATYVSHIEANSHAVTVRRSIEDGYEIQRIKYPCLLTVLHIINEPSMPTLSGKKRARRADIRVFSAKDLSLTREETGLSGSPTRVVKINHPQVSRKTEFYKGQNIDDGIERVIEILRDMAVL